MSQEKLKWLRFVTPGLIALLLWRALGFITGLWSGIWPTKLEDFLPTLGVIILAGVYYTTPLPDLANRTHYKDVTETLRVRLLQIANVTDDPEIYSWKGLRGIFFKLVDSDTSLSKKANLAYFNGYIWTTLADIRIISFCIGVVAVIFGLLKIPNSCLAALFFFVLAILTIPASRSVTKEQKKIGEQQIEIIEHEHLDTLRARLEAIRVRKAIKSNNTHQSGA